MNRRSFSTQVLLYFLMLMFLVVTVGTGCSKKDDATPATTYSISGTVTLGTSGGPALSGVTINVTGTSTGTATTATDGTYTVSGLANGTYTVTPVLTNYVFNPISTVVIINGSGITANFVAANQAAGTYSIAGTVSGAVASGVKITLSGDRDASVITGTDGTYTFSGLYGGDYTVTPYLSGYAFTPASITITSLASYYSGNDFVSAAANFTQADLEGTWNFQSLEAGSWDGWARGTVTIAADGTVTFDSCVNRDGACAPGSAVLTINSTTGVIADSGNADNHYTMAANKTFVVGTQHSEGTTHPAIIIFQKKVDGVSYANADLYNLSFVYHRLSVGSSTTWEYGSGTTNGAGVLTPGNYTDPTGTYASGSGPGTVSVSSAGVVTFSDDTAFSGFLSSDKKTIVGTETSDTGVYTLMVIQITTGQSSSTSQLAGTSFLHTLASGSADFWAHQSMAITSGGVITFNDDFVASDSHTGPSLTEHPTISIGSSGTATADSGTFHGQLSYDGKFMVGVETYESGVYALDIFTK